MQKHNYKNKLFSNYRKAFTLVELLIVIAIIGILFIVLVSKVDFATDKAKATGVQTDFRSFQVAIETVARENAGFNTFGWDTGDTNGNRIRDSYDKGDVNQNGIQDEGEVFIGSKTYSETWTGIYTLIKPGTTNYDADVIADLETAINENLDPKLHIAIDTEGNITMSNGTQDPWKTEYHGIYLSNAAVDGKDRGAIIMYSNGANQEFASEHSIANGIVTITVPGNNKLGADDYSIATIYTYKNGYGKIITTTTGFGVDFNNSANDVAGGTQTPGQEQDPDSPENIDDVFDPTKPYDSREPGLYKTGTNTLLYSWDELEELGIIVNGAAAGAGFSTSPTAEAKAFLKGDLHFPNDVKSLSTHAFSGCSNLTGIILAPETQHFSQYAFSGVRVQTLVIYKGYNFGYLFDGAHAENIYFKDIDTLLTTEYAGHNSFNSVLHYKCTPVTPTTNIYVNGELLENLIVPDGYTKIPRSLFANYQKLKTVQLPESVIEIGTNTFERCANLTDINLENVETINRSSFMDCSKLTMVELPNVKTICTSSFEGCSTLTRANIGNKLEKIECLSFEVSNEFELHYAGTIDDWNTVIYKPGSNLCSGVTSGRPYRLFINNVEIKGEFIVPDHWTSIGSWTFANVSAITSLKVHNNITSIGDYAFSGASLQNVLMGNQVTSIGANAFAGNPFATFDLPDSVVTIGASAFSGCQQLTTITINETSNLTTLGDRAFDSCSSLTALFIPPKVQRLDAYYLVLNTNSLRSFTFSQNSQLEYLRVGFGHVGNVTIYLPDSVKIIKDLDINVNSRSSLVIGQNSQLERMEGRIFDRYYGSIFIPKNLNYISNGWATYQFIPTIVVHPENKNFKVVNECFIDINNKTLLASKKDNFIPTDGSVTSIAQSGGWGINYIPKVITQINMYAFENATGYYRTLTYEGTMAEWKSMGYPSLAGVKEIICSDGVLDSRGNEIQ